MWLSPYYFGHLLLQVQFNVVEQEIISKMYEGQSAVNQAIQDINRLITSSLEDETTPTPGIDVISASDSALVSTYGSQSSSVGSGSDDLDSSREGSPLVDSRASFRRTELVPTVRRFIATCQQIVLSATGRERAGEFYSLLTESVHALIAVFAVSRRSTYGRKERLKLSHGLRQLAEAYCNMLTALGKAMGLPADDELVKEASRKVDSFTERLSSLLDTVRRFESTGKIVFF